MAAHQMANMAFGHLVIGQVECWVAVLAQVFEQLHRFSPGSDLNADKDMRLTRVVVAIVELGDVARPDQRDEPLVGARLFRQGDGKNGLALLTDLGSLGDKTQTVEVEVGA